MLSEASGMCQPGPQQQHAEQVQDSGAGVPQNQPGHGALGQPVIMLSAPGASDHEHAQAAPGPGGSAYIAARLGSFVSPAKVSINSSADFVTAYQRPVAGQGRMVAFNMSADATPGGTGGLPPRPPLGSDNVHMSSGPMEQDEEDDETDSEETKGRSKGSRVKKPHLQGRFSGRLATKDDEKRLAEECRMLAPLLGGVGKRGDRSRLTLAKIVRGIAMGEIRRYLEAREEAHRILTQQLGDLQGGSSSQMVMHVQDLQGQVTNLEAELNQKNLRIMELEAAVGSQAGKAVVAPQQQQVVVPAGAQQLAHLHAAPGPHLAALPHLNAATLAHLQGAPLQQISVQDLAGLRPINLSTMGSVSVIPAEDGTYRLAPTHGLQLTQQQLATLTAVALGGQPGSGSPTTLIDPNVTGIQADTPHKAGGKLLASEMLGSTAPSTPSSSQPGRCVDASAAAGTAPFTFSALPQGYQVVQSAATSGVQAFNMGSARTSDEGPGGAKEVDPLQMNFQFALAPGGKLQQVTEQMLRPVGNVKGTGHAAAYVLSPQMLSGASLGPAFQLLPLQAAQLQQAQLQQNHQLAAALAVNVTGSNPTAQQLTPNRPPQ